ncbi:hypothetical protein HL670_03916 [Serratia plymuthica]|uniref:hypothetical protein n=1 Tax=Serratia plymuthica TaxID=82996 RepID=UPI00148B4281|nr:hypothetical protein [Serratia plymuthica]QJW57019.1 hypothetical protein HL670_03916 [Serratia plymuthica]
MVNLKFIAMSFFLISMPAFSWQTYVSKIPSKNGANAQIIIPINTSRIIQLTCGKRRLDLSYLMMDGVSIVKGGYVGDLKFSVDDKTLNVSGDFYRHDSNFVGLKIEDRETLSSLISMLRVAKKDFYVYESRDGTYIPFKIYLNDPKESVNKFSDACGLK